MSASSSSEFRLFPFQEKHYEALRTVLKTKKAALDASDVGAGKTIVALAVARSFGLSLFEVGPKSVLTAWNDAAQLVGVRIVCLSNYESLKSGKAYFPAPLSPPASDPASTSASTSTLTSASAESNETHAKMKQQTAATISREKSASASSRSSERPPVNGRIDWSKGPVACPFAMFSDEDSDCEKTKKDVEKDNGVVPLSSSYSKDALTCQAGARDGEGERSLLCKKPPAKSKKRRSRFQVPTFHLPDRTLVVVDEAHRAKHAKSQTCALFFALIAAVARGKHCRMLVLSATLSDRLAYFAPFGVALGLYEFPNQFQRWLTVTKTRPSAEPKTTVLASKEAKEEAEAEAETASTDDAAGFVLTLKVGKAESLDETQDLMAVNRALYPAHASRIRTADLGDAFPKNQIVAQAYFLEKHDEVDAAYEHIRKINARIGDLKAKEERSAGLGAIVRALMRIELLKAPIFVELVRDAVASGFSVAVFVKYKATLHEISGALGGITCTVQGGQSLEVRSKNIADFQTNKETVILLNLTAGSTGVSLHDLFGRPRMSLISPTWSAVELQQALGRICRAGAKSPALQRIVFVDGTYERDVCDNFKGKLGNLKALNDGDLTPFAMSEEVVSKLDTTLVESH